MIGYPRQEAGSGWTLVGAFSSAFSGVLAWPLPWKCDPKMKCKIWESDRGRTVPVKVWHEKHYREMADSRFVLCPNGDFVWTYRFFEAAMCGAIPVVENTCPHYDGFVHYAMKDDPRNYRWSLETAIHNFNLCREKLTIPPHLLTEELRKSF